MTVATFLMQPYRPVFVSGDSMNPTFHNGEIVFAEPLTRAPRDGDVVLVDFEARGNSRQGLVGFLEVAIDGREVMPSTGSNSFFEQHDSTKPRGQHPLSALFK